MFVVPKKNWGWRPVINLKRLNTYICTPHFKMENISNPKDILSQGDWLAKLDLQDAYLTVPICPEHQKYLHFTWGKKVFQFLVLPFGLASAPLVFTKLLRPVMVHLRHQGVRALIYLDDIFLLT